MTDLSKLSPPFAWLLRQTRELGLSLKIDDDGWTVVEGTRFRLQHPKNGGEVSARVDIRDLLGLIKIKQAAITSMLLAHGHERELDEIFSTALPLRRMEIN